MTAPASSTVRRNRTKQQTNCSWARSKASNGPGEVLAFGMSDTGLMGKRIHGVRAGF
jgi:hypothetical protein